MNVNPEPVAGGMVANRRMQADVLLKLIASLALKAGFCYFYGQNITDIVITSFDAELVPADWREGRVFGPAADLRWRYEPYSDVQGKMQPAYRVVYCGTALPECQEWDAIALDGKGWQRSETVVLLRGVRLPAQAAWVEPRTPRLLDYPWNQPDTQLGLRLARFSLNGLPQFEQWLNLEAWKGGA